MAEVIRAIIPKGFNTEAYLREIRGQLDACAGEVKVLLDDVGSNWANRPVFNINAWEDNVGIHRHIFPQPGFSADVWRWVSLGTEGPYPIAAVNGPLLIYPENYSPKTGVGVWGRPATSGPGLVKIKAVEHPGILPRHFEGEIIDLYDETFYDKMEQAHKRGVAAMAKGSG